MSQLILQPFRCMTYVTAHSPILFSLLLHHRLFTYVTWRAAHETNCCLTSLNYSRYHHYHKRMAMYCNYIVCDILNIATFSRRYFTALWLEILKLYLHKYFFFLDNPNRSHPPLIWNTGVLLYLYWWNIWKNGKIFTSKFVTTRLLCRTKRIYQTADFQRLRTTGIGDRSGIYLASRWASLEHGSRLGCKTNRLSLSTLQRALVVILLTSIHEIKNFTKHNALIGVNCVCVFQCQPTALLCASGSMQDG